MLINNSLDKGSFVVNGTLVIFLYAGMIYSVHGLDTSGMASLVPNFSFAVVTFIIFLKI